MINAKKSTKMIGSRTSGLMPLKILLAGGGSGGPVAPLIAVAQAIKKSQPKSEFLLVGTKSGPEKQMAENAGINFAPIIAGKFHRYWSLKNFISPFLTLIGLWQAFFLLRRHRPDCIFGAGSFVQVPLVWAGWFLRIPLVIHQQDISIGLANRLCEPFVDKITVCFEKSLSDFSENLGLFYKRKSPEKVIQTGNPFRQEIAQISKPQALHNLKLKNNMPVLLVLGGGRGADFINQLIANGLPKLSRIIQIVHSWGVRNPKNYFYENYHGFKFISDMASAYASADIVLSRAGLSTLTELANLGKVSIIIPMPGTHQGYNAALLARFESALVLEQRDATAETLVLMVKKLLFDMPLQERLSKNILKIMPKNSAEKIAQIIIELVKKHGSK